MVDELTQWLLHFISTQNLCKPSSRGQRPLQVRVPTSDQSSSIYSSKEFLKDLDGIVLEWGIVQLARAGFKSDDYSELTASPPNVDLLVRAHSQGNTIILNHVQRLVSWVDELCLGIERVLQLPTNANVYWTPSNSQGLGLHFDLEGVFIIQTEGNKHWRIYMPQIEHPDQDSCLDLENPGSPVFDRILTPGDVLYIPRGFPHVAWTEGDDSFHITVAVTPITRKTFLHYLVDRCAENHPETRMPLPHGFITSDGGIASELGQFLKMIASPEWISEVSEGFVDRCFELPFHGRWKQMRTEILDHEVDMDTLLVKYAPGICRVRMVAGKVRLMSLGGTIDAPGMLYDEFVTISKADRIRVADLSRKLSNEAKIVLARRLVQERILSISAL